MSFVGSSSPFQTVMPHEVNLHILSFLGKRDFQAVASTCRRFEVLSKDFIWKQKTEIEFGKFVADGAKQSNKIWEQTYEELDVSRKIRMEGVSKVIQTQVKKTTTDDLQYRTNRAASAVFGFAMPNPITHYYPTGQTRYLGDHKITVFKSTQ